MSLVWDSERVITKLGTDREFLIRQMLLRQEQFVESDNKVYYQGPLENFDLSIILRSGNKPMFPQAEIEHILNVIQAEIEESLGRKPYLHIYETIDRKDYKLSLQSGRVIAMEFDKSQLGVFFYLLYLRDLFKNNPNVCVMISDLAPLIRSAKELERDLLFLDERSFKRKRPTFASQYRSLIRSRTENSIMNFRLGILYMIISLSGPYLYVDENLSFQSKTFRLLFERCRKSGARYTVSIANITVGELAHSTILIFDNHEHIIERWDPSGYISIEGPLGKAVGVLDRVLTDLAKEINYRYLSPRDFCPRIGIQVIELYFSGQMGFCLSWSIIYAEERLRSDISRVDLAYDLLKIIKQKYNLSDLKSIEIWLNRRINEIFSRMDKLYIELSQTLGVPVKYLNGNLIYEI